MKTKKQKTAFVGLRLDEQLAKRVDSLAASLGMSTSAFIRRLVLYIDDRAAPCGRLHEFKAWLKRMEQLTFGF